MLAELGAEYVDDDAVVWACGRDGLRNAALVVWKSVRHLQVPGGEGLLLCELSSPCHDQHVCTS